jgi:phosphopantetheine--protein transferase-like protein
VRLVGNDVIDLDEPAAADAHTRARFLARVFGPAERAQLEAASEPRALLWSLFAAKEAAYKVVVKLQAGPPPAFAHRRFEVAPDLGSVRHQDTVLELRVTRGAGWVHAVAWTGGQLPVVAVAQRRGELDDAGLAARALLRAELGGQPGLEIVRPSRRGSWDGRGPPRVTLDGRPLALDVSLSHDGRYVACAIAA